MEQGTSRPVGVPRDLEAAVARVRSAAGDVVGGGFLVDPSHVVTCAHVVASALGRSGQDAPAECETVVIEFPLVAAGASVQASVAAWHPIQPDDRGDIAVLSLAGETPPGVVPARLTSAADFWGHGFRAFGYPRRHDHGVWAAGVLRGAQGAGWVQMEGVPSGHPVEAGFSGGPVWDDELAGVVGMTVAADARSDLRTGYLIPADTLIEAWPPLARRTLPPCPYRGLYPFRAQDADLFFGREELIERLVRETLRRPLVAVVGPSGSGKSSVVFAGLVPSLLQRSGWVSVSMRPAQASSPLHALAGAFLPVLEPDQSETERLAALDRLAGVLRDGHLCDVVDRVLARQHAAHLLLVVDQFEELFVRGTSEETAQFTRALLSALQAQEGSRPALTVVLTLRADFLGSALQDPVMADALAGSVVTIGQMGREHLQSVILCPLPPEVRFEAGLVDRILEDVGEEPGSLPLLEFALTLLWERQERGLLSHSAYTELGGVDGALATYAERVYSEQLLPDDQDEARRLFIQLVRPSEAAPVRRVARRAELGEERWRLGQRIAATRLLVADRDASGAESVELVHEALIDGWARLHEWVTGDMAFRAWQEQLRASIQAWEKAGRDPEALLRGVQLAEADRWLEDREGDLSEPEKNFIRASKAVRERSVRRLRTAVATLTLLVLVASGLGGVVAWQLHGAAVENDIADSRFLADRATSLAGSRPDAALALAASAYRLQPTQEATRTLTGLAGGLRHTERLQATSFAVSGLEFSPEDPNVLALSGTRDVALWDIEREATLYRRTFDQFASISGATFSRDGRMLAFEGYGDRRSIGVWLPGEDRVIDIPMVFGESDYVTLRFTPDDRLLTICTGADVQLWTVDEPRLVASIPMVSDTCGFGFTADGDVVFFDRGEMTVWDVPGGQLVSRDSVVESAGEFFGCSITPDGHLALCDTGEGQTFWWDVDHRTRMGDTGVTRLSNTMPPTVSFTPDSRWALASTDVGTYIWDLVVRELVGAYVVPSFGQVVLNRDGRMIAFSAAQRYVGLVPVGTSSGIPVEASQVAVSGGNGSEVVILSATGEMLLAGIGSTQYEPLSHFPMVSGSSVQPALSPDGRSLAFWDDTAMELVLADVRSPPDGGGTRLRELQEAPDVLSFDPRGRLLAAAHRDDGADRSEVVIWSTGASEGLQRRFATPAGFVVTGLALDPQRGHVAVFDDAGRALLLDSSGRERTELAGGGVSALSFSPTGRWLSVTTSIDTRLWAMDPLEEQPAPLPAGASYGQATFSADEQLLAIATETASYSSEITVWRVLDGELIGVLPISFLGLLPSTGAFVFTQDGIELVMAGAGVHVVAFQPAAALSLVCDITDGQNLSRTEWDQYAPDVDRVAACP
ncbi:nSTAND1 domain-containing NTPase [Geodermatophilus sp. SYSU D01105]